MMTEAGGAALGNKRVWLAERYWDSETHVRGEKRERVRERKRGRERKMERRLKARHYYLNRLLRALLIGGGTLHL